MKSTPKTLILAATTTLIFCAGNALAQDTPEALGNGPVFKACQHAGPGQRAQAGDFVRKAYPGLAKDVYLQMKADYPGLEHGIVDAGLATWREHPGEMLEIGAGVRSEFGPRIQNMRQAVIHELEASYPDFKSRLKRVLSEHGVGSRWLRFVNEYDSELLPETRKMAVETFPKAGSWYPGKFRDMWQQREPGTNPVFDKVRGIVSENPALAPKFASAVVEMTRQRNPKLAEDITRHFLDNQGELRQALEAEFPGAREKIIGVITQTDPGLRSEVAQFLRPKTEKIRTDFRKNLNGELPGFQNKLKTTVLSRYPDLQEQLLKILKG